MHSEASKRKMSERRKLAAKAQREGSGYLYWQRAGYRKKSACENCGVRKGLVVHHQDRNRSNNRHNNLKTLCRACHREEHAAEITAAQRRPEVNQRRSASISKSKRLAKLAGKTYPKVSAAVKRTWQGSHGAKLRASRKSRKFRTTISNIFKLRWQDPKYRASMIRKLKAAWRKRKSL